MQFGIENLEFVSSKSVIPNSEFQIPNSRVPRPPRFTTGRILRSSAALRICSEAVAVRLARVMHIQGDPVRHADRAVTDVQRVCA